MSKERRISHGAKYIIFNICSKQSKHISAEKFNLNLIIDVRCHLTMEIDVFLEISCQLEILLIAKMTICNLYTYIYT